MAKSLTDTQKETLLAIHALNTVNGAPPTIRELREALGRRSDQTIVEMLGRLEKADYVKRDRKQSRGIFLTQKAKDELGIIASDTTGAATDQILLQLDDQEQKLFEKVSEFDPRMGQMYRGALFVIRVPGNEDRIAQSAHSMRQVITRLSDKGMANMPKAIRKKIAADRNTRGTVYGLRYLLDPQKPLDAGNDPYKYLYDKYQTKLHAIAKHTTTITEPKYRSLLKELQYFLLRYIFPNQVEFYKTLDTLIKKAPDETSPDDLKILISKNDEVRRYFFRNVDKAWLTYLLKNSFLEATWEVGDYLARLADDASVSQVVADVFLATEMPADAWQAKTSFAVAASKLPPKLAALTVEKIIREDWIKETRATLLLYRLQDLLKNLLTGKEYVAATALTERLLDIFPQEYGTHGMRDTQAYISEHEYSQIVNLLREVPPEDSLPFLRILVSKLIFAIANVHAKGEGEDYSYIWRGAIEEHEQNHMYDRIDDALIAGVRDLIDKRVGYLAQSDQGEQAKKELKEILTHEPLYSILVRLKLYTYRKFPELFVAEVKGAVVHPPTTSAAWHEHSMLIHSTYPNLDTDTKKKYLTFIDKYDKSQDEYADSWRVRLISIVREYLTPEEKKKYAALIKQGTGLDETELFFTTHMKSGYVGPDSPKNEADFEGKTPSEAIEILKSWEPTGDQFFGPSRSGLGMTFRNVVLKDPTKYAASAELFLDESLRSVYIYNFLSALVESVKTKAELDWDAILKLAEGIVDNAKANKLLVVEDKKEDHLDADWREVMKEIGRIVIRGLDTNAIDIENDARVWDIIEYLAEHSDPTPEWEEKYGGNNMDPYTTSINTVRGDAFHAVFAYVFWYNRSKKGSEKERSLNIPEKVKVLLVKHLDKKHDPALAIRSVYGRFFPWLLSYGKKWALDLIPAIFPSDDVDLRYAAWETYLSNSVFEEAYRALRPQYELAVADLVQGGKVPKRKYWADAVERLAEHVMIAYVFKVEDPKDPFSKVFFSLVNGKCAGMAVSMGGRHFVSRDSTPHGEKTPDINILKEFWDWRLRESTSPSELREFGWWAKEGKFDNEWMLQRLLQTVEKTRGDINGEFVVMQSLDSLAPEYPLLCAKILRFIFASSTRRDRYAFLHMGELRTALQKVFQSDDEEAKRIARQTIDYLLKLGFEDLKNLEDSAK